MAGGESIHFHDGWIGPGFRLDRGRHGYDATNFTDSHIVFFIMNGSRNFSLVRWCGFECSLSFLGSMAYPNADVLLLGFWLEAA
jgi:hypothetical protein